MDERQLLLAITGRALVLLQCQSLRGLDDPEILEAVDRLGAAIDNWRAWGASSNEVDTPRFSRRACRDCQLPIFFAQDRSIQRWLPLDVEPVEAAEVHDEWRYRVNMEIDPPRVFVDPESTGRVYLNHRWTCPMGKDQTKPKGPAYRRRYQANLAHLDKDQIQAVNSLRALLRKLELNDAEGD